MVKPNLREIRSRGSQMDHVSVQLESVLRLRPLLKKEKGDQIVLEPRRMEDGRPMTAVIHPMIAKQSPHCDSPAMHMLSPETLHLCKDTEYHLDQIISEENDQEKVYYNLGLPMARESMDLLKLKKGSKSGRKTSNLVVCVGVENSGKTHTCFGGNQGYITKRRSPEDGLVPRILDSLFSQSKHHVKNKKNLTFGVRMSLVQVLQERTEKPKHDDDSIVQDLLLPTTMKSSSSSPMRSMSPSRLKSVKNLVATMERTRAKVVSSTGGTVQHDVRISIEQDESMDFVPNAFVKTCRDITEARQLLASGLQIGQKLISRTKRAHVLTVLEPVLLAPDGSAEREGGKIGILDMDGIEQSSQRKRNTALRRHKDSARASSGQSDAALNAVLHCVRSLQHNSMILSGKTPNLDIVDENYNAMTIDDNTSEISCVSQEKTGKAKGPSFKVVPYRQHNLTMLLQPFFSARQTASTKMTLLMAAYPGHRDHAEKKSLLNDLELLFEVSREPEEGPAAALTGFEKRPLSPIHQYSPTSACDEDESNDENWKPSKTFGKILQDERPLPSAPSSFHEEEEDNLPPLPPPFAPTARTMPDAKIQPPPAPSAPIVVDFPGVVIPTANENETLHEAPRDVEPNPIDADKSLTERCYVKNGTEYPIENHNLAGGTPDRHHSGPLKATSIHNIKRKDDPSLYKSTSSSSPTKAWLSGLSGTTKSAISHVVKTSTSAVHASTKRGIKMMDKMGLSPERSELPHQDLSPLPSFTSSMPDNKTIESHETSAASKFPTTMTGQIVDRTETKHYSSSVTSRSTAKKARKTKGGQGENTVSQSHFNRIERQNQELMDRNEELENRCEALSSENEELKRALEATGRKKGWDKRDEEEWNKQRRQFAAPPLIQPTLGQHLDETNKTFNTTGRYNFAVGKPQFSLRFPSYFQRASELDRRDREDSGVILCETIPAPAQAQAQQGGEKRKESKLRLFQKNIDFAKRRKSSLIPAARQD